MTSEKTGEARIIDAKNWTPARAETVKSRSISRKLKMLEAKADTRGRAEARKQALTDRSGYGAIPHAAMERDEQQIKRQTSLLSEIQRHAIDQAASQGLPASDLLAQMMPALAAEITNMVLKTPTLGVVTGGGWAYAFEPDTKAFLGSSSISGSGGVALPVAGDQVIDLIVFPAPPFAFQVARAVSTLEGGDLMLLDSVEVDVTVTDLKDTVLSGVSTKMNLVLKSYLGYGWSAGNISGNGTLYLAPGELYELSPQPELPWLAGAAVLVDATSLPLVLKLEEGLRLTVEFEDPDQLIGKDGCRSGGYMNVYSSQDVIENNSRALSIAQAQFDGNSNLVGFVTAAPVQAAFDYEIRFTSGGNWCSLEDISGRFVWTTNDHSLRPTLRTRPRPNVILQTPAGDPIAYNYGFFYSEDFFAPSNYFTPTSMPSLKAGETYWVNVVTPGDFSVNETKLVAQAGDFDVVLESEPLVTVKSVMSLGTDTGVIALLEFYRDGVLVEAFEYSYSELTIQIPAGTYDIRVSGIMANYWEDSVSYNVVLKPLQVERSFTGVGEERLDFVLDLPTTGVHYTLPNTELPYLFTIYQDDVLLASQVTYPWNGGIRTDLGEFDLHIRGPGYDDRKMTVTPGAEFPDLDIGSVQGPVGRLQGTVVNQANEPVEDVNIDFFAEDGLFGWSVQRTGPSGEFDIPKVRNGLVIFNAPDEGDSSMSFKPVLDAALVENIQVKLQDLGFHPVTENGPTRQLLYGTGTRGYQVVFLSEAYVAQKESITDTNLNGVWDGTVFMDYNSNGSWDEGEPYQDYGEKIFDAQAGSDIFAGNEPFDDLNGDGYPNIDDFAVFVQNSKNYIRSLLGTPDIKDNFEFDAYIIFLPSAQAGVDVIDIIDEEDVKIIDVDTLFGGAYILERSLLSIDYNKANQSLDLYAPERDLTVVMLNQPVRRGRANSFILAYGGLGNSSPNSLVAGHEFGHNPGGLADEYNEFNGTSTRYFSPTLKHLTHRTLTADIPWFEYLGPRSDLPISVPNLPGNGVFAGGSYNAGGAYRSTSNSRMRQTAPLFNDISLEVFRRSLCLRSLSDEDFLGKPKPILEEGMIFIDSFEPGSGVLSLCQ